MNKFVKKYIFFAAFWVIAVLAAVLFLPNISQVTAEHGQTKIPANMQSQVAENIQKHWGHHISDTRQVVLVYNNGDKKIDTGKQANIDHTVSKLKNNADYYGIKGVTSANENAATKKQLISKDGTTELVQLNVSKKDSVETMNNKLKKGAKTSNLKSYVTGSDVLNDDMRQSMIDGIKQTEVIAAVFILIVLIIVFRSPIVPLISLLTVGVSFIVSLSVVINMAKYMGFPLSNFTQVFMVVVLFGIGTDYNILLYDRFKDNLGQGMDKVEATVDARKRAGKTILYSGGSVLIGFFALGLAKFSIYQSGVAVAIGVVVLLLVLLSLNPFFMALLGKTMYWPAKNLSPKKRGSRIWHFLSSHSVAHPIIAIALVLVITLPLIFFTGKSSLNYDNSVELSDSLPSKQGLNTVQQHFSKGTAEPSTIYIQSKHKVNNEKSMMEIDRITRQLKKNKEIKTVASVTQPSGEPVNQLYLNNQLGTLNSKMQQANAGLSQIQAGANGGSFNADQLKAIGTSAQSIGNHLKTIQGVSGASTAPGQTSGQAVIAQMQQQATAMGSPMSPQQLQIVASGLQNVSSQVQMQQASAMSGLQNELTGIASDTQNIGNNAQAMGQQLQGIQSQLTQANAGLNKINQGMQQSNEYLTGLQDSAAAANTFYIPNQVLKSKTFKQSLNNYVSSNDKITNITVVLKDNPSNAKSMNLVKNVQNQVKQSLKGTSLNDATVAIGGETATMSDTHDIASQDFFRTAVIMLVGILIALMFVTRSILQPLYIEGTLILTYFTSLTLTRLFSETFLGQSMLTWNTPFFTFIMLIALGVDYSIFLMMRYRETTDGSPAERIVSSANYIGVVVLSAAVILGGTFAALIPSGILTLIQVAIGVIIGLIILVIILPILLPAAIRLTYQPISFKRNKN
ncbi:MMPL family transporter [Fructilactobacillus fructivorans]|uniref:MMPL family transporter n=1 Tax=Fructilactobacillus fructivorans TaxID=1614 RepID=A0AAE6TVS1_9LACO|nr:MMPL family transporter [Fructilactobacillus fructivorans]KRK58270.1 hypothetical protein FC73_GL000655 [Fructilactobacillus fructivorans]QFX92251.1 MMPL family transporter [Fructilactobacillus fructivorans]RDV65301.1 MMPL family transporter [Fructilactobacillus fructivorans]